jgi:hypothetical protein
MENQDEKKTEEMPEQLEAEFGKWQTKIDEAKLQMHLLGKDVQGVIGPHLEKLEQELNQAREQGQQLQKSSESALEDLKSGLRISMKAMEKSFDKMQQHFDKDKKE